MTDKYSNIRHSWIIDLPHLDQKIADLIHDFIAKAFYLPGLMGEHHIFFENI